MTELRRSLLFVGIYVIAIIALGVLDLQNMSVINFANYFYLAAIILVLAVLLIPSLHQLSVYSLLFLCALIYLSLVKALDRSRSGSTAVDVILLELVLVLLGVWLSHRFAVVLAHSETLMDVLAEGTFPSRVLSMEAAGSRIRTELNRGRRYHRPIALLVLQVAPEEGEFVKEVLRGLQRDVLHRLHLARIAQISSTCLRQTDVLIRDENGQFIVLCPETSKADVLVLATRLQATIFERTGKKLVYGAAVFPDEALTFEDLWATARRQLGAPELDVAGDEPERAVRSEVP